MSALLLPPWRVAVSLPGLRAAALLAAVGPVFVVWAGKEAHTGMRLLAAGLAAGVALALVWDDRCAPLAASTPVGLPAVRTGRGTLLLVALVAGWGACALAAERAVPDVPVAATAVVVLAMAALLVAAIGLLARGDEGARLAAYPVPVLLLLLLLLSRLPERWNLLAPPAGPGWSQVRERWLLLLAASAVVVLWTVRDPAARRSPRAQRDCLVRRTGHDRGRGRSRPPLPPPPEPVRGRPSWCRSSRLHELARHLAGTSRTRVYRTEPSDPASSCAGDGPDASGVRRQPRPSS